MYCNLSGHEYQRVMLRFLARLTKLEMVALRTALGCPWFIINIHK